MPNQDEIPVKLCNDLLEKLEEENEIDLSKIIDNCENEETLERLYKLYETLSIVREVREEIFKDIC